jgi:hypothetical protein
MKLKEIIFPTLAVMLLLSSCALSRKTERETISEIYSQTLAYEVGNYCSNQILAINAKTSDYLALNFENDDWKWASFQLPSSQEITWEDLLQKNAESIAFPRDLELGCEYRMVDGEEQSHSSYPNCTNTYEFSRVGFNESENQALVFLVISCGDFSYGNFYFLEFVDGKWKVTDMAEAVIT